MWTTDVEDLESRAAHRRPTVVRSPASVGHHRGWDAGRMDGHYDSLPYLSPREIVHRVPEVDDDDDDADADSSSLSSSPTRDGHYQHRLGNHHRNYFPGSRRSSSAMPPATTSQTDLRIPYKRGTFGPGREDDQVPRSSAGRRDKSTTRTRESSPDARRTRRGRGREDDSSPVRKKPLAAKQRSSSKPPKFKYHSASESKTSSSSESSTNESDTDDDDDDDDEGDNDRDYRRNYRRNNDLNLVEVEEVPSDSTAADDDDDDSDSDDTDTSDDDGDDGKTKRVTIRKPHSHRGGKKTKTIQPSSWRREPRRHISIEEIHTTPSRQSSAGSRSSYVRSRELDLTLAKATRKSASRPASPDERSSTPAKFRSLKRYDTDLVVPASKPSLRRAHTTAGSHAASSSAASSTKRPRNVLGALFAVPDPPSGPERSPSRLLTGNPDSARDAVRDAARDAAGIMVPSSSSRAAHAANNSSGSGTDCLVCMEEKPPHKMARLKCGHNMCTACIKRLFKLSVADPQHMPPNCCTSDVIPLRHAERMFDDSFKRTWNRKFAEFSTRNRIYCPVPKCCEWIKPAGITHEDGRRVARCGRCRTKVCGVCSGRWHTSRECPRDDNLARFLEQAREEGWQRCYRCKTTVELKEGCNQMTCRCGAEFCVICGTKWKNCDCPWFNHEAVENNRTEHLRQAVNEPENEMFGLDIVPVAVRYPPAPAPLREEDMMIRRLHERQDDSLVRRLATVDLGDGGFGPRYPGNDDYDDYDDDDYTGIVPETVSLRSPAEHYLGEDFRRRPQTLAVPSPPPAVSMRHPPPPPMPPPLYHHHTSPDPIMRPHLPRMPHLPHFPHVSQAPPVAVPAAAPTPPPPAPHGPLHAAGGYVAGVSRARGMRDAMDRRLADRFSENRQSGGGGGTGGGGGGGSGHQYPAAAPSVVMSHASMPMPSHPAHASMPMPSHMSAYMPPGPSTFPAMMSAPPPPPPPPPPHPHPHSHPHPHPQPPLPHPAIRRHSLEEEMYVPFGGGPMARRASVPSRPRAGYEYEYDGGDPATASMRRRMDRGVGGVGGGGPSPFDEDPRPSTLAGLNSGRGMNRVFEWSTHVEPGPPEPTTYM